MANRGRPPKPVEQKRALGNPGKRALPAQQSVVILPQAEGVPDPPAGLGDEGLDLWRKVWGMAVTWVSPDSDAHEVEEACRIADDLATARRRYRATTEPADAKAVVALSKAFTEALSVLGFNPTARTRLGVAEVKKMSKLEELRARREARDSG